MLDVEWNDDGTRARSYRDFRPDVDDGKLVELKVEQVMQAIGAQMKSSDTL